MEAGHQKLALHETRKIRMEGTCMELALEGERLCKAGDCRTGVQFFESAVQVGTDDLKTLSAIYSQLGNAYFYLQEYGKALEYHKHDLNLARTIGDKLGEAKASGNLGNTLKVLGKFDEAIACCQRHLDISRELTDKIGEARALYNLGNVYHAKGKHAGRTANQDPGEFPPDVKESLQQAADYYESNLEIVRELTDRAAQGRACGNLGNTHYLLGNFNKAIQYHEERLAIAKQFGDKSAERRAYSNLGNAHIFLGEFETAADQYKKTLQIARQLSDRALEAQACYSLGNTYTLMHNYELAIEYHIQHLMIAQELNDKVGEGRACWSLGNAHTALNNPQQALHYANRHLEIAVQTGDESGQATAQMNLTDLRKMLGICDDKESLNRSSETDRSSLLGDTTETDAGVKRASVRSRQRRVSMENMELVKLTPDKAEQKSSKPKLQKAHTIATEVTDRMEQEQAAAAPEREEPKPAQNSTEDFFTFLSRVQSRRLDDQRCSFRVLDHSNRVNYVSTSRPQRTPTEDEENFFDLLTRFQSRRIDEQRCSFRSPDMSPTTEKATLHTPIDEDKENNGPDTGIVNSPHAEDFLDMVAGIQGSRMNDQRASFTFPGLNNTEAVMAPYINNRQPENMLDDQFFDMLVRCQGSRMEDQRTTLPHSANHHSQPAPTVPDEDFFSLIQRAQSNRLDEQRTILPSGQSDTSSSSSHSSKKWGSGKKKGSKKGK